MGTEKAGAYIPRYHRAILKSFREDFNKISAGFREDNIHRLRLDIKKIRALYKLLESISPGRFDAGIKALCFEGLFSNAGNVRELQVNKARVKAMKFPSSAKQAYIHSINCEIRELYSSLESSLLYFDPSYLNRNDISVMALSETLPTDKFKSEGRKFIKNCCRKIRKLNTKKASDATLHKIRKQLKEMVAAAKLMYSINPDLVGKKFIKEIKEIEETIGIWHDNTVLIESMDDFVKASGKDMRASDILAIEKAINRSKNQNNKLARKFRCQVKDSLSLDIK
jgi:CHAD domain-containing protein